MRHHLGWLVVGLVLSPLACRTAAAPQGGAGFRAVVVDAPEVPAPALFGVCWEPAAAAPQRVELSWHGSEVLFEARGGASNATGRCLREIASAVPSFRPAAGRLEVAPPEQPLDGWAVLAWVKLLAPARFGPERGLADPAPLVRACLRRGPLGPATVFDVRHVPGPRIQVLPAPVTEAERCVEAVLGSTAWPSGRSVAFELSGSRAPGGSVGAAAAGADEVAVYFSPHSPAQRPLDPVAVKEAMGEARVAVGRCWDEARARRPGLGGSRTLRLRTSEGGVVSQVWVVSLGEGGGLADYRLDRCLEQAVRQVRVPGGPGDGLYTWVFASRG